MRIALIVAVLAFGLVACGDKSVRTAPADMPVPSSIPTPQPSATP